MSSTNKTNWDVVLPYLLLALRDTVNSATNFTPAELVFSHRLRNMLQIQRDAWERGDHVTETLKIPTVQLMRDLNQPLQKTREVARENVIAAQSKMKAIYDRRSTERKLNVGQLVLLLEPTSNNNLLAQWAGPAIVRQCLDNNNYLIEFEGRRMKRHGNSLREFSHRIARDGNESRGKYCNIL